MMRVSIAVAVAVGIITVLAVAIAIRAQQSKNANAGQELRRHILETVPESASTSDDAILVVMDMVYPGAVVSVMSATTGDASIYFSNGGGVLGGIGHEKVRVAANAFVYEVERRRGELKLVSDYSYPNGANVRFFLRTGRGVYMAEVPHASLMEGKSSLAAAFWRAQDVITELRTASGQ